MSAAADIPYGAAILGGFRHGVPVPPAVPVRRTRRPYKLGGSERRSHLRTRRWRSNTFRRRIRTRTSAWLGRRAEW
ncbi:MAG: hypothetical protein ACK56F_11995, partial [bacterium]